MQRRKKISRFGGKKKPNEFNKRPRVISIVGRVGAKFFMETWRNGIKGTRRMFCEVFHWSPKREKLKNSFNMQRMKKKMSKSWPEKVSQREQWRNLFLRLKWSKRRLVRCWCFTLFVVVLLLQKTRQVPLSLKEGKLWLSL